MESGHSVNVLIESDLWDQQTTNYPELFLKVINLTLQEELISENVEINVKLTDNNAVQILNAQFRGQDKPTNILSFPADEEDEFDFISEDELRSLGDLALSYETIEKEARDQGKTFQDHLIHLIVHGTLHLLHYDHMTEEEAEEMEGIEIKILENLGISNPYLLNEH